MVFVVCLLARVRESSSLKEVGVAMKSSKCSPNTTVHVCSIGDAHSIDLHLAHGKVLLKLPI